MNSRSASICSNLLRSASLKRVSVCDPGDLLRTAANCYDLLTSAMDDTSEPGGFAALFRAAAREGRTAEGQSISQVSGVVEHKAPPRIVSRFPVFI